MSKKYDLAAKTIVLGDGAVGKTSLIRRYVENKFEDTYNVTLGAEFLSKTVQIKKPEKVVKLAIWDLAGQAKYASYRKLVFTGVNGAFLVFDRTRKKTFTALKDWYHDVLQFSPNVPVIIMVNKADLRRKVTKREVQSLAEELTLVKGVFNTSAKTGEGVTSAFEELARQIVVRQKKGG
ncbi:MAG: Rab family GTPase [Promethearchaeota archaeon]